MPAAYWRMLPVEPLLAKCPACPGELARRIGRRPETVRAWIETGRLSVWNADRAAVELGYHPAQIWGEAWWQVKDTDPSVR